MPSYLYDVCTQVCNCLSLGAGKDFLLSQDELQLENTGASSNYKLTCAVCNCCILHDSVAVNNVGVILAYGLANSKVCTSNFTFMIVKLFL